MREAAPFWSLATLVTDSDDPAEFQVSLEDMISDSGELVQGELSQYNAKGTPFSAGDVLFGKLRPYLAKYWLADREGTAGGDIHVYRPTDDVEPRFLSYVVGSRGFVRYAAAASKGVKMPRVEWMGLREFIVYRPELIVQSRIADYLDRETGEIRAMLGKLDELANHLGARRTSVIDRELMPHVGVSTARLGLVAEAITGLTYVPADVVGSGGTVVHRSGSIQDSRMDRSDLVRVTTSIPERLRLREGDLLVCSRNGSAHLVGKNALVGAEEVGETWGAFMTVLRSPNNRYVRWYLQSTLFADERSQYATSTINQLTIGMINRMEIPYPGSDEQERIADHLDEVTGKIDQMLAKVAELKALLLERRSALITDVVTGRKEIA
ncbi:restriction endonuclease subunit S [Nesterenkonia halotolerans]|uniref:Type I restriction enzyme S subunit n=1 Tax=Nesterenkonia halotolerans TaxID=225325 RepID=A0ABR9J5K5_9MICC|nr:restriction endonuclease subunit S [Nesterenkonia halotolerans]MBE1514279.1 type I restriction enzyme S subunit [Nesterenkonia halotolerans]